MDGNHANKFTIHNPNLEIISMDSHIFHDQIPFINPSCYLQTPSSSSFVPIPFMEEEEEEEAAEEEELGAMKEMMYKIAAMQPVDIDPATIRKPKRRNVRISDDPQSVAARHRRERISERIRILQRLVPGGTKMDTASMLDEAIRYVKFLKRQIRLLQSNNNNNQNPPCIGGWQPIASAASSSLESPASAAGAYGFAFGASGGNHASMSYNHEVISD